MLCVVWDNFSKSIFLSINKSTFLRRLIHPDLTWIFWSDIKKSSEIEEMSLVHYDRWWLSR